MNRRPASALDSDESGSDWDTTVAESSIHQELPKPSVPNSVIKDSSLEGEYATITPKTRTILKGSEEVSTKEINGAVPKSTRMQDKTQTKSDSKMASPPPHMTTFQKALSDYSTVYEIAPDLPVRGYEGKGKLYTVPETDSLASPRPNTNVTANWDDSDAEELVLKELQQNLEKEKQRRQIAIARDRKAILPGSDRNGVAADNYGYTPSPKASKSNESTLEKWSRSNEPKQGRSPPPGKGLEFNSDGHQKPVLATDLSSMAHVRPPHQQRVTTPPMIIRDSSGKKGVFYFEEGNPHFLEIENDSVDAFLPAKIDELEKVFRRVWREVFAALRILTSVFVLFLVELILFLTHHILRPLILDSVSTIGNYIIKPMLTLLFNVIFQPVFAFLWNVFNALYQVLEPFIRILGAILSQVAIVLRAFRLVTVQYNGRPEYRRDVDVI